jgi:hypothetical protein
VERFTDFIIRHHAGELPVDETLRRLMHTVMDQHQGRLEDDATVLFCKMARSGRPGGMNGGGATQAVLGWPIAMFLGLAA